MSCDLTNIGAVIVTWNSSGTIERCLESCAGLTVTVVDNASSDDTVARVRRYPHVYLIENSENRGFAAAVNQGIARSPADYILLLNPDVELTGSIAPLQAACEANAVIATGRLVDNAGETQRGFTVRRLPTPAALMLEVLGLNRVIPSNPVNRKYRCVAMPLDQPANIEQPPGAFLFFKRDLWNDLGGFDEQFAPVWFEDVDFCKRALKRGPIRYVPSVTARHRGGASIARMDWACRELCWYGSLLRYASKHFSPRQFRGVCGAVVLASAIRMAPAVLERRTFRAVPVYAKTAGLALRGCVSGRLVDPGRSDQFQQGSRVRTTNSTE